MTPEQKKTYILTAIDRLRAARSSNGFSAEDQDRLNEEHREVDSWFLELIRVAERSERNEQDLTSDVNADNDEIAKLAATVQEMRKALERIKAWDVTPVWVDGEVKAYGSVYGCVGEQMVIRMIAECALSAKASA